MNFGFITRNPSTTITAVFAFLMALTPMVADFQEATTPLGIPPYFWALVSAGLGVIAILGKMWQAIYPALTTVTWRWPSVIGFAVGAVTILTPYLAELADASAPFNLPPMVFVAIGGLFTAVTYLGRVFQAVAPFSGQRKPANDVYGPEV